MKAPETTVSPETIQSALESTWKKIEENKKKTNKPILKLWKNQWIRSCSCRFHLWPFIYLAL